MRHSLLTALLAPVLLVQGLLVRKRTPRLPEPTGPRSGRTGAGVPLRLLITGDSSAAGVGAATQGEALSGRLVERLAREFSVTWRLEARTGHRTADTVSRLRRMNAEPFDVAVVAVGVNDVTGFTRRRAWRARYQELRGLLADRFGVSLVICCGLPPMQDFPALPQPLRWYFGLRAGEMTADLRRELAGCGRDVLFDLHFSDDPALVASDGFHPGPGAYSTWADGVAGEILSGCKDAALAD